MLRYPKQNDVLCGLHRAILGTFIDINIRIKYKRALQYVHRKQRKFSDDVHTSLGNDKHISDIEIREADQLKSLTLDPPAKFGVGGRIWSL